MTAEPAIFVVALPDGTRKKVRARGWWRAAELALGGQAPDPGTSWQIEGRRDGVEIRARGKLLVRVIASEKAPDPSAVVLTGAHTAAEACRQALVQAQELVASEAGAVLLADGAYLRFVAASGPRAKSVLGVRIAPSTGVAGYAMQTQRPVLVGEADQDPRHFDGFDALTGYRTGSLLAVPLCVGGTALGVLELMNPPADRPFRTTDLPIVERVAQGLARRLTG